MTDTPDASRAIRNEMTADHMQRMSLHEAADFALHMPDRPKNGDGHNAACSLCTRCTLCRSCVMCERCSDCEQCYFCRDCVGCNNCFGCTGIYGAEYTVFNVELTQAEYTALMKKWSVTQDTEATT